MAPASDSRLYVITGASAGLGLEAALALAAGAAPATGATWPGGPPTTTLVLAGRDVRRLSAGAERAQAAGRGAVEAVPLAIDLSSLADVKRFAGDLLGRFPGRKVQGRRDM